MPINLLDRQIPQIITWFNNFVGFRDMYGRLERAEAKLRSVDFASPTLNKRYFFHVNYKRLILRNRLCRKISLDSIDNYQPISFAASVHDAARNLSTAGMARLRAQILDGLGPDRDFRAIEHEMRVYTHYRQQECQVNFADLEGTGKYDFNIRRNGVDFEVEAKTLTEDIGNLVSTEQSIVFFQAYKEALSRARDFRESGFFTYSMKSRSEAPQQSAIADRITDFLMRAVPQKSYGDVTLSFEQRRDWVPAIQQKQFAPIREAISERHRVTNSHAMIILGHGQVVMFCISGSRPLRLFKGIRERLKHASSQLTGSRPGMIWMHFLGLEENEFTSLSKDAAAGQHNAFSSFGQYVFSSEKRKHVCRVRFSGESQSVHQNAYRFFLSGNNRMFSQNGPAYDLISNVSTYDAQAFE